MTGSERFMFKTKHMLKNKKNIKMQILLTNTTLSEDLFYIGIDSN